LNILITGAAGYIGSNLLAALIRMKVPLHINAVDNFYATKRHLFDLSVKNLDFKSKFDFYEADFYDLEKMVPLLEQTDTVVHLAEEKEKKVYSEKSAITSEQVMRWQKNVEGYRRLLEASIICGVKRVILCSWAGVYVISAKNKLTENEPLVPINQYYHQKISQEYYTKMFAYEYLLDTVTLRMSNVYGVGPASDRWCVDSEPAVIPVMIDNALRDKEIVVHSKGLQKRNFVYVGDVVDALVNSIFFKGKFSGGTFNICSDEEVRIIDIANWIAEICGATIHHKDVTWQGNIIQHPISNVRAKKVFGFNPKRNMRQRLQEMVETVRASQDRI
jgi:nucleoside-diphosphate-sugar epimerase